MNKADSLENKFNKMADGEDGGSAGREERKRKSSARVVDYEDADEDLRNIMEQKMRRIDLDPSSFEAVISYGTEPLEALGKVAKDILKIQASFNEQVKTMDIAMDNVNKGFAGLGVENVVDAVKKMVKGAGGAAASGGKSLGKFLGKMKDSLTGADKKRTEEEAHVQMMIDKLPDMYMEMQQLALGLREAEGGLKEVMQAAEKLGFARVESVKQLNIFLGAAPEILRRYDDVYIREAQMDWDESQDPEDELHLNNMLKAKDNFRDQYRILESSRAQGLAAAQQLRMMMDEMEKQRRIIQQFRTVRENEWLALMSSAGIAASSLKVGQMIKKSDEAGDKVHTLTSDMMEKAHDMTLESQGRGTVDPEKLIESLNRMKGMIEKENEVRQRLALEQEATRQAIRGAANQLLETVEKARHERVLEAAPTADKEEKLDAAPDVANDNAQQTPAVAEKSSPRKRSAGPSKKP